MSTEISTGHSTACRKPSTSGLPKRAARSLQDINNEAQQPSEIPLIDVWTMPNGNQPKLY